MKTKYGLVYYKDTDNIGDDIQTYAAMKLMPKYDYVLDREELDSFIPNEKESVVTLMNGWYLHKRYNWPISPYIYPLFVSMHFSHNDLITTPGYDYLDGYCREIMQKYEPIGCRDLGTQKALKSLGYQTYYSGCVTMTIPSVKKRKVKPYVCAVDLKPNIVDHLSKELDVEVKKMTHCVDPNIYSTLSFDERIEKVEELLKIYQDATLVVTDRLHTALPCLAIGVPVLLIYYEHNSDRLETFKEYVNNVSEKEFLEMTGKDLLKIKNGKKHLIIVK